MILIASFRSTVVYSQATMGVYPIVIKKNDNIWGETTRTESNSLLA